MSENEGARGQIDPETVGCTADKADTALVMARLPGLPPSLHVQAS